MADNPVRVTATRLFTVTGLVRETDGTPIANVTVQAFDEGFRTQTALGETKTNDSGAYTISYNPAVLVKDNKQSADLFVQAVDAKNVQIARSQVLFHAPDDAEINLTRGNQPYLGPSEALHVKSTLAPILGSVSPASLTGTDIAYLKGQTGVSSKQLQLYAQAAQSSTSTQLAPEAFYAFSRTGMPTNLTQLYASDAAVQKHVFERAAAANLIPPSLAAASGTIVTGLRQQAISSTLQPNAFRMGTSLLNAVGKPDLASTVLGTYLDNKQSPQNFWTALAKQTGFDAATLARTKLAVQFGTLTQYHPPLIAELLAREQAGSIHGLSDLARLTTSEWVQIFNQKTAAGAQIGIPPGVPGATAAEQAQNYAEVLTRRLEVAFPTVALSGKAGASTMPGGKDLAAFLDANPAFDIAKTNAVEYLKGKQVPQTVATNLPAVQRLFKVAPRFEHIQSLFSAGYTSARSITQTPLTLFVTQMGTALGGTEEAEAVYARSQVFFNSAVSLFGQYASTLSFGTPRTMPVISDTDQKQIPNWTSLFGAADYCACEDCRSILSPAAYLVDLLNTFLNAFVSDGTDSGAALLLKRRPDIGTLQLSCPNTNTTLPYIDLVNELLEDAVNPGGAVPHDSTDGTAADLAAMPEYINYGAYTALSKEVFPWNLPFDLAVAQARAYLANVPVQRYQLMETFAGNASAPDPTDGTLTAGDAISAEYLGVTPLGWRILTGASGHNDWELWGASQTDWNTLWTVASPGPSLEMFLAQTGLQFQDLVDLLTTAFAQSLASAKTPVVIDWNEGATESCDLTQATINNLSAAALEQMVRFLRVRLALGCSVLDLDKIVSALQASAFSPQSLAALTAAARLQGRFNLPWSELGSWWGQIPATPDAAGGTSLYERLFLNPAITNPLDKVFGLNASGTELADTSHFLEDAAHQTTLLGGLGIAAADLTLLLTTLPLASSGGQHTLNMANLSELFRAVSMARALGLSTSDFVTLAAVLNLNLNPNSGGSPARAPFDRTRVGDALWVADQAAGLPSSGFTLAELNYLLLDQNAATSKQAPGNADMAQQLTSLATSLQPILAQTGGANPGWSTLGGAAVEQQLATWLSMSSTALNAWLQPSPGPAPVPAGFTKPFIDVLLDPAFVGAALPVTTTEVQSALATSATPATPLYYQARALIKLKKFAVLATRLSLQTVELSWLLSNAAGFGLLDLNVLPANGAGGGTPLYDAFYALVTASQLRTQLAPAQPFFNLLAPNPAPPEATYLQNLSALTSWKLTDLQALADPAALGFTYPADFQKFATLKRLQACFAMLTKLGASATQVLPWTHALITFDQANAIANLVKLQYSVAQWPAAGKSLRDPLRQQQRDALVSYLVFHSQTLFSQQFRSPDDLFGYFLIDTQMASCMLTSRIIQTTQSVQTYISRCLLNLEPGVTVSAPASQYWTWMKQYRLWQANREVFLYPENWLDPTLRDDQTDFFKTLTQALHQGQMTETSVENAYLNYLTSLDGVGRLQVCGMYHQIDTADGIDVVHVFARTEGSPAVYYYRTFVNQSSWTQWEKVDLDVPGTDVIPVIYNRRLYLVWPVMKVISVSPSSVNAPSPGQSAFPLTPPDQWVQIQIAWSQYTQQKWSAKKTSPVPGLLVPFGITTPGTQLVPLENEASFSLPNALQADGSVDPSYFAFKAIPPAADNASDELHIECYAQSNYIAISIPGIDAFGAQIGGETVYGWFPEGPWIARFTISGCHDNVSLTVDQSTATLPILPPPGMEVYGMQFLQPPQTGQVFVGSAIDLPTGNVDPSDTTLDQVANQVTDVTVLGWTPNVASELLYPHQYLQFSSQDVFFEQDVQRSFFVVPRVNQFIWYWAADQPSFGSLQATVNFYGSTFLPVANAPVIAKRLAEADVSKVTTQVNNAITVTSGGILNWGGEWTPITPITFQYTTFTYSEFFHPYVCSFIRAVKQNGIDGLLKWPHPASATATWPTPPVPTPLQLQSLDYFQSSYDPQDVNTPYPLDEVDFSYSGTYSQYNWELFFHAPMYIAHQLSQDQQFEQAQNWFHYIFDPTDLYPVPPPNSTTNFPFGYWKLKPFYEQTSQTTIEQILSLIDSSAPGSSAAIQNFQQQVAASIATPFNPFAIARLRTTAFQRAAVMQYLDNLIAWADNLFTQNTRESINEATQLYILVEQLLGPRPEQVQRADAAPMSYNQIAPLLAAGDLSDPLVQIENAMPVSQGQLVPSVPLPYAPSPLASALYFCIPPNPQLLSYWDTVADRLYKIRHCQNISGQFQQLPLLAPPISPGLLVQAAAAGVDLSTILQSLTAPPPLYHFPYLYKQAVDFTKQVETLGSMLLTGLEKSDAENLANIRATQEVALLTQMRQELTQALQLAQTEQSDLQLRIRRVQDKLAWYQSQPFMYSSESVGMDLKAVALISDLLSTALHGAAGGSHLIPEIDAGLTGVGGSATVKVKFGGSNVGSSLKAFGTAAQFLAVWAKDSADMAMNRGKFQERQAKFQLEIQQAQDELNELNSTATAIAAIKTSHRAEPARRSRPEDSKRSKHCKLPREQVYEPAAL